MSKASHAAGAAHHGLALHVVAFDDRDNPAVVEASEPGPPVDRDDAAVEEIAGPEDHGLILFQVFGQPRQTTRSTRHPRDSEKAVVTTTLLSCLGQMQGTFWPAMMRWRSHAPCRPGFSSSPKGARSGTKSRAA